MTDDNNADGGRKFFRIPVDETSNVSITIGGTSFKVINVAPGGIGIYLEDIDTFSQGSQITDIVLTIDADSCTARGCIAHISPEGNNYLCGIEILEMNPETSKLLTRFIDNHKASLFSF